MKEVIIALAHLVEEQGKQIVTLSQALAIAHEHHGAAATYVMPPSPTEPYKERKLWLTEEEEDNEYAEDPIGNTQLYHDILAEVGLAPNIEVAPGG